ncbi:hypothetical protein Tco_0869354, partial [Tanacetum coccineum]
MLPQLGNLNVYGSSTSHGSTSHGPSGGPPAQAPFPAQQALDMTNVQPTQPDSSCHMDTSGQATVLPYAFTTGTLHDVASGAWNFDTGVAFSQEDAWAVLRFHPKWDAPEQVDLTGDVPGASQEDLFGHDARPCPPGKQRPAKKSKSDATASTGGSSASAQFGELMEQELRLKREAAERAFEAQAEKDRTLMRLEELRFLTTSTKDLDEDDAYWIVGTYKAKGQSTAKQK